MRQKEDHDWRAAQALAYKNDKLEGRLALSYQQNGGTFGADNRQIFTDISQTDLQYNRTIDLLGTGGYSFNRNHKITVSGQFYTSKFNGDRSLFLGDNLSAFTTFNGSVLEMRDGFDSDRKPGTNRWMGTANYHGSNLLGGQDLYIQLASRAERLDFYPFPGTLKLATSSTPYASSSRQNTNYTGFKALLSKRIDQFNFSYGIDVDFEKFFSSQSVFDINTTLSSGGLVNKQIFSLGRYPTVHSKSYAAYLQADYDIFEFLKLSGGIRYQKSNVEIDDFIGSVQQTQLAFGYGTSASAIPGGKSDYDMTMFNASLLYNIQSNQQAWFTYSEGISLADPAKYYGIGVYKLNTTTNNWDLTSSVNVNENPLQGIKTGQFELGYRIKYQSLKAQISGFISNSDKSLAVDKTTYQVLVNNQKLRNKGIEAEAAYNYKGFTIGANTLLIKSEVEVNGDWQKQEIYNASPSKLVGYLAYGIDKWNFRFQTLNNFKLEDALGNKMNSYNTSDLFAGYKLPVGKLNVGVQNLFNTKYQSIWSKRSQVLYSSYKLDDLFYYQGRGRTFSFNYTIDF